LVIRASKLLARLLVLLLAGAAVAVGAFAWLLSTGPVSVAWLNPYIEKELSAGPAVVQIEDSQLRLGDDRLLDLTAIGVRVSNRDGKLLGELPEVEIGLNTSALLLERAVAVRRIAASAPTLRLTRREDGSIGFDDEGIAAAGDFDLGLLLADLLSTAESTERWGHLEEVSMSGGRLLLEDRSVGRTLQARNARLRVLRRTNGVTANLAFTIVQADRPATVAISATHEQGADQVAFEADLDGLALDEYAGFVPSLPLSGIRLVLGGKVTGAVALGGERMPIHFDLAAQPGAIELPELGLAPLQVDALELQGTLAPDLGGVAVERLGFSSDGAHLSGRGAVAWRDGEPTLEADLEAENVAVRDLERYWPPEGGREARKWVTGNLTDGVVPKVRAKLRFGPGELGQKPLPEHTLDGEFAFDDVTVRYLDTMPPIVGVKGSATFTGQSMNFDVSAGHVGDLVVDRGSIVIKGIGIKGRDTTPLEIVTHVSGPVAQALELIDHPPLGYASKVGIAPEAAAGRVAADLRIGMPLHRDLEPSDVRVAAQATIADGALAGTPVHLSDGQLTLTLDNHGADLVGNATIEEVPLRLNLRENFDDAAFERRYRIQGVPELATLRRLGLDLPIAAEGSVGVDATITEAANTHRVKLALDLAPAAIDVPEIGWRKAAGEPGSLDASAVVPADGPIEITDFALASQALSAEGSLEARSSPFRIERLRLDRVRLGQSEGTVALRGAGTAGYEIDVNARTLDLTPLLAEASGGAAAATPVRLSLSADRLMLDGKALDQVKADLVREPEGWRSAVATARLPDGGEVTLSLAPEGEQRRLRLISTDAGNLLRTLQQTGRVEGGQLTLEATVSQQRPSLLAEGKLEVRDFRVLDAPILARLLTLASLTGVSDLLTGEGLWLDRLEAPFTCVTGRWCSGRGGCMARSSA
jgi:hypothetical protein